MEKIIVKKVEVKDVLDLQKIASKTFEETFSSSNTKDDMQNYLVESFSENKLITELENNNSLFYFAKIDDKIVGYLKLNFGESQTEKIDKNSLEIERIYVLSFFKGKKIGQTLFNKAVSVAIEKNLTTIWLGVWEENTAAINFYLKNGFEKFDQHTFKLGNDEQIDWMMRLKL